VITRGRELLLAFLPLFVLLLLLPLADSRPVKPQVEYDKANQLFLRGLLEECQSRAAQDYVRYRASDPEWAARFRLLEGEAMILRGMYQDGLQVLAAEPSLLKSPKDKIQRLALEGAAYIRLEQFSLAEQKLVQAEALCAISRSETCGAIPRARGNLAVAHGDFRSARQYFLEGLSFARTHHDELLESYAYQDLGLVSLQEDHFDEALGWSKEGYAAAMKLGNELSAQIALGNLGWAYFGLGDLDRALKLFIDAEKQAARLGSIRHQVTWLATAANVYQQEGDFARAAQALTQALALARKIDSKEEIVDSLEDLAYTSIDAGKIDDAAGYVHELEPRVRASGNRLDILDVQFAQGRIAAGRRQDQQAEALFRTVEHDHDSQTSMRLEAEHQLARLYEVEGNTAHADQMYRTSLATFEAARAELKHEDSKLPFLANATGIYDDYIHFLVQHGKAGNALALADQSRARTLAQGLGVSVEPCTASSSCLEPGAVARKMNATLLFYWLGRTQSYLWVIAPAKTELIPLPAEREILPVVARYRKALLSLGDPIENSNQDGVTLYQTLVAPAAHLIKPASNVVILSDGQLSLFNYETLIVPGPTPHYWIEDATLISAPSLYLLASAKPQRQSGHRLLLMGDAISPGPDYPELPMAPTEIGLVSQRFPAPDQLVFARERATAAAYLNSAPQKFAYIHFVAHGVSSSTEPLDSAIILSPSGEAEDSFKLHAREIMQHPIRARLVTISACYGSGVRTFAGEGAVGLAWAFLHAGAHNVIGALWEVSDMSTPHLMDELYQYLQSGLQPGAALRQAKLTLLHSKSKFCKPFYWAPMQIYTGL
jgi:CHAT domain-containing protein